MRDVDGGAGACQLEGDVGTGRACADDEDGAGGVRMRGLVVVGMGDGAGGCEEEICAAGAPRVGGRVVSDGDDDAVEGFRRGARGDVPLAVGLVQAGDARAEADVRAEGVQVGIVLEVLEDGLVGGEGGGRRRERVVAEGHDRGRDVAAQRLVERGPGGGGVRIGPRTAEVGGGLEDGRAVAVQKQAAGDAQAGRAGADHSDALGGRHGGRVRGGRRGERVALHVGCLSVGGGQLPQLSGICPSPRLGVRWREGRHVAGAVRCKLERGACVGPLGGR